MKLIFLISLPRSGSTLLQRILASHPDIGTHAEPWLLLPLVFSLKKEVGVRAVYGQRAAYKFISDLERATSKRSLYPYLRNLVLNVYNDVIADKKFFLDKTPRYYMIVEELFEIFPDAKYIFLYRNPIDIVTSIISTTHFCDNDIGKLDQYMIDLEYGFIKMLSVPNNFRDSIIKVKYEDLVCNPEKEIRRICEYLNIPFLKTMLVEWKKVKIKGSAGDKEGIKKFGSIDQNSFGKWSKVITNGFRKYLVLKYVKSLPEEYFSEAGYDKLDLLEKLEKFQVSRNIFSSIRDLMKYFWALGKYKAKMKILGESI